jgi:tRNA (adenine57-N1/adenine58-N1)-methyltransferase catalytic subunit
VIPQVYESLKNSGSFVAICPTFNQLEKTAIELRKDSFVDVESIEIIIRTLEAREGMTRPSSRMIAHTTYLIFGRKVSN